MNGEGSEHDKEEGGGGGRSRCERGGAPRKTRSGRAEECTSKGLDQRGGPPARDENSEQEAFQPAGGGKLAKEARGESVGVSI